MANIYPDKGYFEVATHEQQLAELRRRWSGKHELYNSSTKPCTRCEGKGYTRKTRTEVRKGKGGYQTTKLGSGCPVCHGTGKVSNV